MRLDHYGWTYSCFLPLALHTQDFGSVDRKRRREAERVSGLLDRTFRVFLHCFERSEWQPVGASDAPVRKAALAQCDAAAGLSWGPRGGDEALQEDRAFEQGRTWAPPFGTHLSVIASRYLL